MISFSRAMALRTSLVDSYQTVDAVILRKARDESLAMFPDAARDVICYAGVESTGTAGHNVCIIQRHS